MTRKITIVAVLVVMLVFWGMAFAFQNEPEGFRGLKWGDPPGNMIPCGSNQGMELFELSGDKMYLGDAQFYRIRYAFWNQKFMAVSMFFENEKNYDLLKALCESRFGEKSFDGFGQMLWRGSVSLVVLKYDIAESSGMLIMADRLLFEEYTAEREKMQAEKAKGDW